MVPYHLEFAVLSPSDDGVRAELGRVFQSIELLLCHVGRIEIRTGWTLAVTLNERSVVIHTVPWSVIDEGQILGCTVRKRHNSILVTESLLPENVVCLIGSFSEKIENLFSIVRDTLHIRRTDLEHRISIHFLLQF